MVSSVWTSFASFEISTAVLRARGEGRGPFSTSSVSIGRKPRDEEVTAIPLDLQRGVVRDTPTAFPSVVLLLVLCCLGGTSLLDPPFFVDFVETLELEEQEPW